MILDENLDPHLLEVNAGPSFAIDNVVPVDPREVRKGHYAPSKPANSRFADASPVLHECASLDLVPDVCYCRDGGGGGAAHVHELSAVDAHVKSSALAGALEIVRRAQKGGRLGTGGARGHTPVRRGGEARRVSRAGKRIRRRGGGVVVRPARGDRARTSRTDDDERRRRRRRRTGVSVRRERKPGLFRPDGRTGEYVDSDSIDSAMAPESTSDSPGADASSPSDASSPGDASPSTTPPRSPTH